jgi:hypothetical protein
MSDIIRQYAYENGYNVGTNAFSTTAMEGMVSSLYQFITGGGDLRKGTSLNFGTRFGTKGMEGIENLFKSDHGWWRAFGGAAGETLAETAASLYPFWHWAQSVQQTIRGVDHNDEIYPLTAADFLEPLKNVAGYNLWDRLLGAIKTGQWMSRKGRYLGDVDSTLQAIIMSMTGVMNTETADAYNVGGLIKDQRSRNEETKNMFLELYGKALRAAKNNDPDQEAAYMKQAMILLNHRDFPEDQLNALMQSATEANMPMTEQVFKTFRKGKQVPQSKKEEMDKAFHEREEREQVKGNRP